MQKRKEMVVFLHTDVAYILRTTCIAVTSLFLVKSNWRRVLTNHMGLVRVLAMKPAQDAEQTWTMGESAGRKLFQNTLAWE